jgi:hypothetical protein
MGHDLYANLRKLDASGAKRSPVRLLRERQSGKQSTTVSSAPRPAQGST